MISRRDYDFFCHNQAALQRGTSFSTLTFRCIKNELWKVWKCVGLTAAP